MSDDGGEAELLKTFAVLADNLVDDYDAVDLLQTLVDRSSVVLDVADVGILLANTDGALEVVAATDERSQLIELMQLREGGPCVESYQTGRRVAVPDIRGDENRWPLFRQRALDQGFAAVHCYPMRLRTETIGSLNLFGDVAGAMSATSAVAAQALADVATIGILQSRAVRAGDLVRQQLQHALDSRVVIEQAKGVVSYQRRVATDEAFTLIRSFARSNRRSILAVATEIVERRLTL
jgi:hypothetical protein